jgi:hypothetical protein
MDPDPDGDPDPAIFITDLQEANKKQFFKDKESKRSRKTIEIKIFQTIFA